MIKRLKRALEWVLFILTGKEQIAREAVDEVLCDFSGQGRDKRINSLNVSLTTGKQEDDKQ